MIQSDPIETIYSQLVTSLQSFFKDAKRGEAAIGISGGIDSAVVAALAVKALGANNVHGILMPSQFSTLHSITDGVELCDNLNIKYDVIPIEKIYGRFMRDIRPFFGRDNHWDNTQENLQARIRGTIMMAYSNRKGALVLNTTNKSELSVGYGTLYGDLAGSLMVLADIYKTDVYELAEYINKEELLIPISIITKAPSAELRFEQKDSDSLPEYKILDEVLYLLNEKEVSTRELIRRGYDKDILKRIISLRKGAAFKRHQLPQMIQLTNKPLLSKSKCL
jgi:NAD+ synthase (glutamine-hydrolysing)